MDRLTMCFNNVFTDSQAESAAGNIQAASFLGAVKPFKDALQMFFRNTDPIVAYFDEDMSSIRIVHAGGDRSVLLAVFDRILYKIQQYLPDLFLICKYDQWRFATLLDMTADTALLGHDR